MEFATGDYLYFLDDDNIMKSNLYEGVQDYLYKYDLIFFNQLRRDKIIGVNLPFSMEDIDTGQMLVSRNLKSRWSPSTDYREERLYVKSLLEEVGKDKMVSIPAALAYYNFLKE